MSNIIIYGSKYGSSKKYAEELSRRTGIEVQPFEKVRDINIYDTIVYIGSLYAGGIRGLKKTFFRLKNASSKKILIATVGLADPADSLYSEHIRNGLRKQVPEEVYENMKFYHLRGAIDYSMLSFVHKIMLSLFYKMSRKLPEEKKTADIKTMIETYNTKSDFINFETLSVIEKEL